MWYALDTATFNTEEKERADHRTENVFYPQKPLMIRAEKMAPRIY